MPSQILDLLPDGVLQSYATRLGCTPDDIEAVTQVEAPREAFDSQGIVTCLQERHITWEACATWGIDPALLVRRFPHIRNYLQPTRYPKGGYGKYADQYKKFNLIRSLPTDHAAELAICGCSWGAWQVLGKWWQILGYPSPQTFLESMRTPEGQLEAFARYIEQFNLKEALYKNDWDTFARGYNGKDYKAGGYHWKLAQAKQGIQARKAPKKPLKHSTTIKSAMVAAAIPAATTLLATANQSTLTTTPSTNAAASQCATNDYLLWLLWGDTALVAVCAALIIYRYVKDRGRL